MTGPESGALCSLEIRAAERKKRLKKIKLASRLTALVLFLLLAWAFIEPRIVIVSEITISSADLPAEFDGYRIAHLSDFHHGPYFSAEFIRRAVDKTNAQRPDLVLMTGDYVSWSGSYIKPCFDELARLEAAGGVLAVLGNHDYWAGADETRQEMERAGIKDLENRAVWVSRGGARIKVAGVGDLWEGKQDLGPATADAAGRDFVVLLCHNPDFIRRAPNDLIDLMLCGHTHGGQVTVFGLYAPRLPIRGGQKYRSGVVREGAMTAVISRGIGAITPPVRFFCPAQIIIITLRRGKGE